MTGTLDDQLFAAYLGGANDANDGVKCKRATFEAWKARHAAEPERSDVAAARREAEARRAAAEIAAEWDLASTKTRDILREIIEDESERDVTGGFRPGLERRVECLYAEIDRRIPPRKVP